MGGEWSTAALGQVAEIQTGKLDSNHAAVKGAYPFFTCAPEPLRIDRYAFDCDAILLAGNNANGIFHLNRYCGKFNAYQRTYVITPKISGVIDIRFLYYVLHTLTRRLGTYSQGTATKFLTMRILSSLPIPLPPLSEQRAIAHILGILDDKIELNLRMNATLEEMVRALFKSWFVDFDPVRAKPNDGIRDCRARSPICSRMGSRSPSWARFQGVGSWASSQILVTNIVDRVQPSQATEAIPYVPIECISPRTICLSDAQPGSNADSSLVRFQQGDILLGAMRPYFHKVCIAPFAGTTRTTVFILRPDPCELGYTALVVSRDETIDFATAHSEGSTIPYAKWTNSLDSLGIVLPPRRLRQEFHQSILPTISRMMASVIESRTLAALRDTLLPKLISGQVRVYELRPSEESLR